MQEAFQLQIYLLLVIISTCKPCVYSEAQPWVLLIGAEKKNKDKDARAGERIACRSMAAGAGRKAAGGGGGSRSGYPESITMTIHKFFPLLFCSP